MSEQQDMNNGVSMSRLRMGVWIAGAMLLLTPLVAMQFTAEVNWTPSDFVFAAVLIFGSLGAYELVARSRHGGAYRLGAGLGIVAAFLLIWINGAVGITDSDADLLFPLTALLGGVGCLVARFRPGGMALALMLTAVAQLLVGVLALTAGWVPAYNSAVEILGLTGFFAVLFGGSALLLRQAAQEEGVR